VRKNQVRGIIRAIKGRFIASRTAKCIGLLSDCPNCIKEQKVARGWATIGIDIH